MKTKIQRQYFTRIRWFTVKASLWDRIKFKLTFGLFGRMEWIDREEAEFVQYFPVMDNKTEYASRMLNGKPMFDSGFLSSGMSKINCRCAIKGVE